MGKEKYDAVILAFSHNYADALAGSYLSCAINAPILLVNSKQDNIDSVQSYIKENLAPGGTIYMLGGTAVVPEAAVKGLTGFTTKRLWGKDRYETNVAILKEAAQFTNDTEIIVASGNGFADSLSAAATGKPILLVKNTLQPVQKEYLNSLEGDLVFDIIGGTGAVSDAVMKELNAYGSTNRTGGATRYETSVNVAKKFFDDPEVGVLAYGQDFPDGLCGGALAHAFGGPLILTANGRTDAAVEYANETGMKFGAVLGGPTLISDASAKDIYNMGSNDKIEVK
jgi:putative cell wall-binding protein